jgi:hypothetical protein
MNNIEMLIPELAAWNNGRGATVGSWISGIGRYDHAIGYSTIFWPKFVVYDDCVFRQSMDAETYRQWMDGCRGDKSAVEAAANHKHIADLFVNSESRPSKDVVLYLGSTMREMWSCKLKMDFPSRQFDVEFPYGDTAQLVDYQITFFQKTRRPVL